MQGDVSVADDDETAAHKLSLGTMATAFGEVFASGRTTIGLAIAGLTAIYVASDLILPTTAQGSAQGPLGIVSVVIGYAVTVSLLKTTGAPSTLEAKPRIGAYIGLSLLEGLGILLGLIALVLPGLFLAARWILAAPMLIAEGIGVTAALGKSWRATARAWPLLLVAQLLLFVLPAAAVGVMFLTGVDDAVAMVPSIVVNALLSIWSISSTVLSVAVYRLLADDSDALAEVFA